MNGLMGIRRFQEGGSSRDLTKVLPSGWDSYSAADKINWFNRQGATEKELTDAGVAQADINWMKNNGFNPGTGVVIPRFLTTEEAKVDAYNSLLDQFSEAEVDAAIINQAYGGDAAAAASDLAYLKTAAAADRTGGTNTTTTNTTNTTNTVTGGTGNDTITAGQTFFAFGDPRYTWNTTDSLAKKQQLVQQMLGAGFTVQQIRNEISRLEPDRSALTEANFELLGLKLPTQTGTTTVTGATGNDTITGGAGNDVVRTTSTRPTFATPVGGLGNLATIAGAAGNDTIAGGADQATQATRTDFSRLPPELRFAGQYAPLLAERVSAPPIETAFRYLDQGTQGFGDRQAPLGAGQMSPGLRTAFEIGLGPNQYYQNIRDFLSDNPTADAIAAAKEEYGVSDVDIQRALASVPRTTAAPTAEEAFRNYIYAGGADATEATTRGLQYARNLGLTPEQATALFNRSLGTSFGLADYDRVMAENAGLFPAMPATPTTQVVPTAFKAQAPVTGGLAFAQQPGQIGTAKYYENIAAAIDKGIDPNRVLSEMATYGITTDDLVAARAMYPSTSIQALGSVAATPVTGGSGNDTTGGTIETRDPNDEGAKAGGLISRYAGGPVTGSPQYFEEGGEVEPMRKYTPAELGSTFDISEYIDPDTGRFMINEYRRDVLFGPDLPRAEEEARARMTDEEREMAMRDLMIRQGRTGREYGLPGITVGGAATGDIRPLNYYYAEGGQAKGLGGIAMRGVAEELRQQGRNGDTILAHINPQEAAMLEAMGGSGTINPRTGLPEYGFSWKKLFKIAAPVLGIIGGPVLGLSLAQTALAAGALSGASTPGKTFDFGRGLQAGLMTYLGGKLGEQVGTKFGAAEAGAAATPTGIEGSAMGAEVGGATVPSPTELAELQAGTTMQNFGTYGDGQIVTQPRVSIAPEAAAPSFRQDPIGYLTNAVTSGPAATLEQGLGAGYGAYTSGVAADERIKAEQEANAILMAQEEDEERMRNLARRTLGGVGPRYTNPTYVARGGLIALAGGGAIDPVAFEGGGMTAPINQPRMLAGGGDGMSDSIPATIDGTQPARLADGEFVIPADVVADIGNGSSSAGAKRLYGMMDRVRTARHGTTKQPPEIKMNRLMPA